MNQNLKTVESEFKRGLKGGISISLGYFPIAFALGVAATKSGFSMWISELFSALLFTASGESAFLNLIKGGETAIFTYALTIFVINCRYILLSLSLSQRLDPKMNVFERMLFGFFNTDEIFAIAVKEPGKIKAPYLFGMATFPYLSWVVGSAIGWSFTDLMPASVSSAMGILLYAMFICIIVPPAKTSVPIMSVVGISIVLSLILECIPVIRLSLSSGWIMIICAVIASLVGAIFFPVKDEEEEI